MIVDEPAVPAFREGLAGRDGEDGQDGDDPDQREREEKNKRREALVFGQNRLKF